MICEILVLLLNPLSLVIIGFFTYICIDVYTENKYKKK